MASKECQRCGGSGIVGSVLSKSGTKACSACGGSGVK